MSGTLVLGMSLPNLSLMFVPIKVCFGPSNIWPFSLFLIDSKDFSCSGGTDMQILALVFTFES